MASSYLLTSRPYPLSLEAKKTAACRFCVPLSNFVETASHWRGQRERERGDKWEALEGESGGGVSGWQTGLGLAHALPLSLFLSIFLSFTLPLLVLSFLLHSFFTLLCSSHATLVENAILIDDTILLNFLKNFNESSFRVFGHWRTERGVGI